MNKRRLATVDGVDFARPVVVRLVKVSTSKGEASELEFRPLMSRNPRRVSLERLAKLALQDDGQCECLFGLESSPRRGSADAPGQLYIPGTDATEVAP